MERNIHKDYERTIAVLNRISDCSSLTLDDYLIKIPTLLELSNTEENNRMVLNIIRNTINDFHYFFNVVPFYEDLGKYNKITCSLSFLL